MYNYNGSSDDEEDPLAIGSKVKIVGLHKAKELNGFYGVIHSIDETAANDKRFVVHVFNGNKIVSIQPKNLQPASIDEESAGVDDIDVVEMCDNCAVVSKSLKACGGCKITNYCSIECQKLHWAASDDGHREECKRVMELKQMIKDAGFCKKV